MQHYFICIQLPSAWYSGDEAGAIKTEGKIYYIVVGKDDKGYYFL